MTSPGYRGNSGESTRATVDIEGPTLDRVATRSQVKARSRRRTVVTEEVRILGDRESVKAVEESVDVCLELLEARVHRVQARVHALEVAASGRPPVDAFAVPAVLTTANPAITSVTMINRRIPPSPCRNQSNPQTGGEV
jgi:hypothetical protein